MNTPEEISAELKEIKREVIETRNLIIKNDNTMRSLFAELKKISGAQQAAEKKAWTTSIAAYFIIAGVIIAAAVFFDYFRALAAQEDLEAANRALAVAREEGKGLKMELESRDAAEKRAAFLLKLIEDRKKTEAVAEFKKLGDAKLPKVELELLEEKIGLFKKELARKHYDQGVNHFRLGGFKSAIQEMEMSATYQAEADYQASRRYYQGAAYLSDKAYENAIDPLKEAINGDLPRDLMVNAHVKLTEAYLAAGRLEEARAFLDGLSPHALPPSIRQTLEAKHHAAKLKKEKEPAGKAGEVKAAPGAPPPEGAAKPAEKAKESGDKKPSANPPAPPVNKPAGGEKGKENKTIPLPAAEKKR